MPTPVATSWTWTCPQCQRRVPARMKQCHCGLARPEGAARSPGPGAVEATRAATRTSRVLLLLGAALVALCGLALVMILAMQPDGGGESAGTSGEADYPPLPPVTAGTAPPAQETTRPAPADVTVEEVATPRTTPSPSVVAAWPEDAEWDRAAALLDPLLGAVSLGTRRLEEGYRAFTAACVAPGLPPRDESDGEWLRSLREDPPASVSDGGPDGVDCRTAWSSLAGQANDLKSQLDAAAKLAREHGVRPDQWHRLTRMHYLDVWAAY